MAVSHQRVMKLQLELSIVVEPPMVMGSLVVVELPKVMEPQLIVELHVVVDPQGTGGGWFKRTIH